MKNGEGCPSPTPVATYNEVAACRGNHISGTRGGNSMSTARGGNHMPKILDAPDEIEVYRMAMHNLKELQRGMGLNQL